MQIDFAILWGAVLMPDMERFLCTFGKPKIAKLFTSLQGIISPSHPKNSGDQLDRIKNINMKDKLLASLNIQSLYTNISLSLSLSLSLYIYIYIYI